MKTISEMWPGIGSQGFRRNQIEWALWRVFHKLGQNAPEPPAQFTTRIKRLLDLDRRLDIPKGADDPDFARYAYFETPPRGKGLDTQFLAADGFCLAIGLDLLDLGLNQGDAIFLGRGVRHRLTRIFKMIIEGPARDSRLPGNPEDYPDFPTYKHLPRRVSSRRRKNQTNNKRSVDFAIYLLVRRMELTITLPDNGRHALPDDIPVFLEPEFLEGSEKLGRRLAELRLQDRKAIVLELGFSATSICRWLWQAPIAARGRQKAELYDQLKPRRRLP